jgi:hypothetical protein
LCNTEQHRFFWFSIRPNESQTFFLIQGEAEPKFEQTAMKRHSKAKFGDAFGFEVSILIPPGTTAAYAVSAITSSTVLNMCRIRVKGKGGNIPCLPEVAGYSHDVSYVNKTEQVNMVKLTLGSISNIGKSIKYPERASASS